MATNNKIYMKEYQRNRRALTRGFNVALARKLHGELIARGVDIDDARWCVLDAARRGIFGYITTNKRGSI